MIEDNIFKIKQKLFFIKKKNKEEILIILS